MDPFLFYGQLKRPSTGPRDPKVRSGYALKIIGRHGHVSLHSVLMRCVGLDEAIPLAEESFERQDDREDGEKRDQTFGAGVSSILLSRSILLTRVHSGSIDEVNGFQYRVSCTAPMVSITKPARW